ncbi:MAG: hypothetical protein WAX29_06255, partial [Propionibacterium sp.]
MDWVFWIIMAGIALAIIVALASIYLGRDKLAVGGKKPSEQLGTGSVQGLVTPPADTEAEAVAPERAGAPTP